MITTSSTYRTVRIISLLVTHSCNLNCVYCFEKHKELGQKTMTFDTARQVLQDEFEPSPKSPREASDRLAIEFFGGEPMLNFKLIRQVYQWVRDNDPGFPVMFQLTSNGTLFTPEVITWFDEHKLDFRVVLSVDGDDDMHQATRGISASSAHRLHRRQLAQLLLQDDAVEKTPLPSYSRGIIDLTLKGYRITSSLAEGIDWDDEDARVYRRAPGHRRLLPLAPRRKGRATVRPLVRPPLRRHRTAQKLRLRNQDPHHHDTDGTPYPCHLFIPIVRENDEYAIAKGKIDFYDDRALIDDHCLACPLAKLCRTCYGYNLLDRGDVRARNLTKCKDAPDRDAGHFELQSSTSCSAKRTASATPTSPSSTTLQGLRNVAQHPFQLLLEAVNYEINNPIY